MEQKILPSNRITNQSSPNKNKNRTKILIEVMNKVKKINYPELLI